MLHIAHLVGNNNLGIKQHRKTTLYTYRIKYLAVQQNSIGRLTLSLEINRFICLFTKFVNFSFPGRIC